MEMAINLFSMRKKSRMSAWRRSMSSTRKATKHPHSYNLSAMVVTAATAVEGTAATAVEGAITAADVTVAGVAITDAEAAVAPALG
jgi:hypothetical protein